MATRRLKQYPKIRVAQEIIIVGDNDLAYAVAPTLATARAKVEWYLKPKYPGIAFTLVPIGDRANIFPTCELTGL
jgi:hypothetical protein